MLARLHELWAGFEAEVRKTALLFLALYVCTLIFEARLTEASDWVVGKMTASGLLADAIRGLIGPLGLLSLVLLVLLVHAYWDTRPGRSSSGQSHGMGTVTMPNSQVVQEIEALREELALSKRTAKDTQEALDRERRKVTTLLEKLQNVETDSSAARRAEVNSPLALAARPLTVEETKERADWILAHPTFGRDFFQHIAPFGPHDAWIQAERELKAERLGASVPVIPEAASVDGKPTRSAIEERALLLQEATRHFAPLLPRGVLGPDEIWGEAERELIQELRAGSHVAGPASKPRQSRPSTPRTPKAPSQ